MIDSGMYCRATMTLVATNGMRPGYDCRCSGCMSWVATMLAGVVRV